MEDKNEGAQLIDKLIKKRKEENDAFIKLLQAIEKKSAHEKERRKGKINS